MTGREYLKKSLEAVAASSVKTDIEVLVVDNNSADGTVEMVQSEFPQVRLIANKHNFGFARANNQAIRQINGSSEFILLLNPDMIVLPNTLSDMLAWMRVSTQAAVAGCHLVSEHGATVKHVRRFPRLLDQLAIVLKLPHLFPNVLKDYLRDDFDYDQPAKVDSVRGGFFMMPRSTIEQVGLLDERYFIWFEEVDYCRQVYQKGLEVWYTPVTDCIDFVGQSFKQVKRGTTQKYFQDSMLKYFKKWHPLWQYLILRAAWPIGRLAVACGSLLGVKNKANT
ncbi:glycosyltransferase family 2 protein [Candidatus Falkowbacteria bacterium]|nr:glycosyltransferase family 2 protein [Candidatus Falkowbacteria bacterium]